MGLEVIKADKRRRGLCDDWEKWLKSADKLYNRFVEREGVSPFRFHEVASVGFLASASAVAGFLPLAEYEIIKRAAHDRRLKVDGRADLWFDCGDRCYSFEFKRAYVAATKKNLRDELSYAFSDVARIDREEYHYAAGALIARVTESARMPTYYEFAEHSDVDYAYHIGPDGVHGAFLFFKLVQ